MIAYVLCVLLGAGVCWLVMRHRARAVFVEIEQDDAPCVVPEAHPHCGAGTQASKCGTATRRVLEDSSRTVLE